MTERKKQAMQTKQKLLQTAMEMMSQTDEKKIKISDLCQKAGVSVGTFYHYFKNLDELIQESYLGFDELLREALKTTSFVNNKEGILRIILFSVQQLSAFGVNTTFMTLKQQMNGTSRILIDKNRFYYQVIIKYLENGKETGEFFLKYSAEETADWLLRTSRGTAIDWCLHDGEYDITKILTQELTLLLDNLCLEPV